MPLITRQGKGSKLTIQEMDGNLLWMNNLTEVTYAQLSNLAGNQGLVPGQYYLITDFRTCYDRPDYDQYRNPIAVSESSYVEGDIDPIVVLATANDRLAIDAYQPSYPFDTIKYDKEYNETESGGVAFGRIIERVDEWGNRADYDHRVIEFKRYRFYTYDRYNPIAGTVELQNDGVVLGSGTTFTSLAEGQIIAIRGSNETFYQIVSIIDDTTMDVAGNVTTGTGGGGFSFFSTSAQGYDSYYQNNLSDPSAFVLYNTFEAATEDGCLNTYIGDHSKYFINEGIGDFLLANNVLKDGRYENNTIGDSSYNNTFNDDCTANQIGYGFRNNITDDDFDSNVIGNFFNNNIITANFNDNHIGINFEDNIILCSSFYRNQIGNDFRVNWIDGDWGFDFENNQIGNEFNNNEIYKPFYKNAILNGYNNNQNWSECYGNKIGNAYNDNEIYSQFYENEILDGFQNNTIGDSEDIDDYDFYYNIIGNEFKGNTCVGYFYGNHIGHDFVSNSTDDGFIHNVIGNNSFANNIGINFGYNTIGYGFQSNTIDDDFGYGGGQPRGNKIGNEFQSNNIGEYFYDNTIGDRFGNNEVGDYCTNNKIDGFFYNNTIGVNFQNNDIKVYGFGFTDFATNQGNILGFTTNTPNGADNTYTGLIPDSDNSAYGTGATFDVTVAGGIVTVVNINQVGNFYENGDVLTINGTQFGGVTGGDNNLSITVSNATKPYVNKVTNCTIFNDEDAVTLLSYIDNTGTLQVILPTA